MISIEPWRTRGLLGLLVRVWPSVAGFRHGTLPVFVGNDFKTRTVLSGPSGAPSFRWGFCSLQVRRRCGDHGRTGFGCESKRLLHQGVEDGLIEAVRCLRCGHILWLTTYLRRNFSTSETED